MTDVINSEWPVRIDSIKVVNRHRKNLGDVDALAASIETIGLINPITIDRDFNLVAGERRLAALQKLGRKVVEVRIIEGLDDAASRLTAERDENTCRKDMTASELYALGKSLEALKRPEAEAAKAHGQTAPGRTKNAGDLSIPSVDREENKTYAKVGRGLGMSPAQWKRLKHIGDRAAGGDERAADALAAIDRGEATIAGAYGELRQNDPPPEPSPREPKRPTKKPAAQRIDEIRDLAEQGYRASQIAERFGVKANYIRFLANQHGVTLPDIALGKTRAIDPNRIVEETVNALEGLTLGLELLPDDLDGIDYAQVDRWASSLTNSLRSLNRLAKQMKELAS